MKLWLISRTDKFGYDEYDSAVVAAKTEADARETHPADHMEFHWLHNNETGSFAWGHKRKDGSIYWEAFDCWVVPAKVKVELIGNAKKGTEAGIICASFNAG